MLVDWAFLGILALEGLGGSPSGVTAMVVGVERVSNKVKELENSFSIRKFV